MPSYYFTRIPAVRPPQRLLSLALCGWLALFVLVATPQGVSADCCPFNGASFYQDSVVIYESAGMGQPPGILPLIGQSNNKVMGVDYPDDSIINVVASQQSGTLKGILFDFNTSCDPILPAALYAANNLDNYILPFIQVSPIIALIKRGSCSFTKKLGVASTIAVSANLTLVGVILYDNEPDSLLGKSPNISTYTDNDVDAVIAIVGNPNNINFVPTIFVRNGLGQAMLQLIDTFAFNASISMNTIYGNSAIRNFVRVAILNSSATTSTTEFWMSFLKNWVPGLLMAGLTVVFASVIYRLHHRRTVRNVLAARARAMREISKLPRSILETFPIQLYNAEEVKNQSCVICLDDFVEGESSLRLLPCSHGFCVECIDPWLSTKSAQCPICKFNFLPPKSSTDLSEGDPETVTIEMTVFPVASEAENTPQTREIWEQVERLDPEVAEQERRTKMEREERKNEEGNEEVQGVELETVVIGGEAVEEGETKEVEKKKTEAVGEGKAELVEEERPEAAEVEKAPEVGKADAAEEKKAGMAQENRGDIA